MRFFDFCLDIRFSGVPFLFLLSFNISFLQAKPFIDPGDPNCSNPTEIGGFVFEDINANGIKDNNEPFLENITVSLFDNLGTTPLILNTNISGEYLFTGLISGNSYRVEFTLPNGMQESKTGSDSHSATQFTTAGSCNNNLGISQVECYCEEDPFLLIPCYVEGPYNGIYGTEAAVTKLLVSADGHDFIGTTKTADYEATLIASHEQVGSVYGIAWQNTTDRYYVSAFHKRYIGFGPNGPDAIYQMDLSGNITGVIELDALLGSTNSTGADVHDFTAAANGHVYDLGVGDSSFDGVGKIGFGDMVLSGDKNTLYVVNLFDKKIYALDVTDGNTGNASVITSWDAPDATTADRHRPFGLAFNNGKLWIGTVDENGSNAYVHSLDPQGTTFDLKLTVPLNYPRQTYLGSNAEIAANSSEWNAWATDANITLLTTLFNEIAFPQPILSDIAFTKDGEMILGFRDRFGDQSGTQKYFNTNETAVSWGNSAGDILKACYDSGTDSYTLETGNTGSCAGTRGIYNSGPGSDGIEFYHWDIYSFNDLWDPNNVNGGAFHWETTQGALLQLKSKPYVISSTMDPFNDFSGGIVKFNNADGGRFGVGTDSATINTLTGGYTLFETGDFLSGPPSNNNGTLSKANGLGALDAACSALPLEIGNYVWYDSNGNGIQDANEKGIPNISVTLTDVNDVVLSSTNTDVNGNYLFTDNNVTGGINYNTDYKLKITLTDIQSFSPKIKNTTLINAGSGKNDNHASMIGSVATISITTGTSGQTNFDVDFGFAPNATIGNTIWLDENANGIFDAGEEGIPNVTVLLRASDNSIVGTTITDVNGGYIFKELIPDNYTVEVSAGLPIGLIPTFNEDTGTLLPDMNTGVNIAAGATEHLSAIFGFNYTAASEVNNPSGSTFGAIGNRIWNDANGNGIQDVSESGIPNVSVDLFNDHDLDGNYDNLVNTITTDATGFYIFDDITPGAYVLKVDDSTLPSEFTTTPTGDPDQDADNISEPMMVAPGDVVLLGDFGYQPISSSSISDVVFIDANADGLQDTSEPSIPGVTIQLKNNSGTIIASTTTDTNGNYSFDGLTAGTYTVTITDTRNILTTLVPVSDADGSNDLTSTVTVDGSTDNNLQDFGFAPINHQPAEGIIGNTVFIDTNNDFTISPNEGVEKVTVNLFEADGTTLVSTTETNKNGTYYFGALNPVGTYVVGVDVTSLPGGNVYYNSVDPDGAAPGMNLSSSDLSLNGGLDFTKDFGYTANTPYEINGTVWEDTNADGTLDGSEAARFVNTTILLTDNLGSVIAATITDAFGSYSFQNLPDGIYMVVVNDLQESLTGFWHSLGIDSENDPVTVTISGADQTDIDFGYYNEGASVGNRVWNDLNTNGIQDSGETGIANVEVTLTVDYDGDSSADVTVVTNTDSQGFYSFGQLLLDEGLNNPVYVISAETPVDMETTTLNAGSNNRLDASDPNGVTVVPNKGENSVTAASNPASESTIASFDFGFNAIVLPVELVYFSGSITGCQVELKWSAASEINFSHYEVEQSEDGRNFKKIKKIVSIGELTSADYSFMDIKPGKDNYYRLKMVDNDESFEYSNIINLSLDCKKVDGLKIYPNPLSEVQLTVEMYTESSSAVLLITDFTGKKVKTLNLDTEYGQNTLRIDTGDLPNGTYFIYDSTNSTARPVKFVKMK